MWKTCQGTASSARTIGAYSTIASRATPTTTTRTHSATTVIWTDAIAPSTTTRIVSVVTAGTIPTSAGTVLLADAGYGDFSCVFPCYGKVWAGQVNNQTAPPPPLLMWEREALVPLIHDLKTKGDLPLTETQLHNLIWMIVQ